MRHNHIQTKVALNEDCISTGEAAAKRSLESCAVGVRALPEYAHFNQRGRDGPAPKDSASPFARRFAHPAAAAAMAAAAAGWARSGESPALSSLMTLIDPIVVGRGVLTAPQSHPNESFVFNRLRGATPNRSLNRFSRTPKRQRRRAQEQRQFSLRAGTSIALALGRGEAELESRLERRYTPKGAANSRPKGYSQRPRGLGLFLSRWGIARTRPKRMGHPTRLATRPKRAACLRTPQPLLQPLRIVLGA